MGKCVIVGLPVCFEDARQSSEKFEMISEVPGAHILLMIEFSILLK